LNQMDRPHLASVCALVALSLTGFGQQAVGTSSQEYPTARVREEQQIIVDGLIETWQLRWTSAPKPLCGADDSGGATTCPCRGFAYGEAGDLFLLRLRDGVEIDRLRLTPFFTDWRGKAVLQRWPVHEKDDFTAFENDRFPAVVRKRAMVQLMHFGDYDHDGRSLEFYLQTEALPCGKSAGIVVGLSQANPRLHVFGTASNPRKPLSMQKREWEALRDAAGPVDVLDWACADHGADTETRLRLRWTDEGIIGVRREYSCSAGGKAHRRLIHQEPL
jgi:hypothetical protein